MVLGLVLLALGLLVPIHLRALDEGVVARAGRNSPGLVQRGLELVRQRNLGGAQLLLQAAGEEGSANQGELGIAVAGLSNSAPPAQRSLGGTDAVLERLMTTPPATTSAITFLRTNGVTFQRTWASFTELLVRTENRTKALEYLSASKNPGVAWLMRCRSLTNTVFPASETAAGQALDMTVCISGLLLERGQLTPGMSNWVVTLAVNAGRNAQPFEDLLLDLVSLGNRMDWGQLSLFIGRVEDPASLHTLADAARKCELPVLFAAVCLSEEPGAVGRYWLAYDQSGLKDLGTSMRYGASGVQEVLRRGQRLYVSKWLPSFRSKTSAGKVFDLGLELCWRTPWIALTLKWVLYMAAGFLLAAGLHFARPAVSVLERPLQVRGFHLGREGLFALGFLLAVLLVSEPFLAQESRKGAVPFRAGLPTVGKVIPTVTSGLKSSVMNQQILIALLLFFVLQGLLYVACLLKLAEIRRQSVPPRIKLRLLENEDHLFDAGLYLGFVGTIISLILFSVGIVPPSLMAAYSSTSFGIIFVSIFKICNLRPLRRKLLLESEAVFPAAEREPARFATAASA